MPTLNLTGQQAAMDTINPKLAQFRNLLEARKDVWQRATLAKKRAWVKSANDPVIDKAWDTYRYLRDNFFQLDPEG